MNGMNQNVKEVQEDHKSYTYIYIYRQNVKWMALLCHTLPT